MLTDVQKCETVPISALGCISRSITELNVPLYENWRGEVEPNHIPNIAQFSE